MRHGVQTELKTETRMLGLIALLCYSATLAAALTCGYALLGLALRTLVRDFVILFNPAVM